MWLFLHITQLLYGWHGGLYTKKKEKNEEKEKENVLNVFVYEKPNFGLKLFNLCKGNGLQIYPLHFLVLEVVLVNLGGNVV